MSTFNVCYLREYRDPENECDTFNLYETIYRNVPIKYLNKFKSDKMKMKLLKHCDWNYKESAKNFERFHSFEEDICNCVKKYKQKKKETFIRIGRVLLMLDS